MSEEQESAPEGANELGPKAPYSPPALVRHGTVDELTRGTVGILQTDALSSIGPDGPH